MEMHSERRRTFLPDDLANSSVAVSLMQNDTPYKGGTFHFKLELPSAFPFKAPSVGHFISSATIPAYACPADFIYAGCVLFTLHSVFSTVVPFCRITKLITAAGDIRNQSLSSRDQRGGPHLRAHPA